MNKVKKAWQTFKICKTLFMARTFGEYLYSGWSGRFNYCSYRYRGKVYDIPLSSVDVEGFY